MSDVTSLPGRFNILTVCTGNICRSPLAEYLLRDGIQPWPLVKVASAGTGALVGHPMTDQTITIAHGLGISAPEGHRARMLDIKHLRDANLVIALTRSHRSEIVSMLPRGSRQTFTLRELARLLEAVQAADLETVAGLPLEDTAGRLEELTRIAASLRGFVAPPDEEIDDDVIDPYRRSDDVYEMSAAQLVPAVRTILERFELAASITPIQL
jgi:protein-tyrosine phosphatase